MEAGQQLHVARQRDEQSKRLDPLAVHFTPLHAVSARQARREASRPDRGQSSNAHELGLFTREQELLGPESLDKQGGRRHRLIRQGLGDCESARVRAQDSKGDGDRERVQDPAQAQQRVGHPQGRAPEEAQCELDQARHGLQLDPLVQHRAQRLQPQHNVSHARQCRKSLSRCSHGHKSKCEQT